MHEMAITQGIIEICEKHAHGRPVRSIDIEIGELSSVVPEAVQFCFEACSQGTLLEGAIVRISRPPGSGLCLECGKETALTALFDACRHCGAHRVTVISGEEMRVREIEVDD